jgi:energy-coupling factor transport system ATP-binding protein
MKRKCVIFDESTAMLDPLGRQDVMNTAMKLNREDGITVILITHYMSEAALADRIIVMDHGKILRDGTPSEVFSDPEAMWDAGLDVPQTTELLYKMRQAGLDVRLDLFDVNDCAAEIARAIKRARGGK